MQEVVEKAKREKSEKPTKPEAQRGASMITAPRFEVLSVPIVNMAGSPLVIHAFSQKARDMMKDKQQAGSQPVKNPGGRRAPKDFEAVYQGARYISTEGWDGASAAGFRNSMIGACRLIGYKMTIGKMAVFVEADGISGACGTPLVRIHGEPVPFELPARNASGVADIRIRPRWDTWKARLRIRFDVDQLSATDVVNLLLRAGEQGGIGEGRPSSAKSNGLGWGMFQIDHSEPVSLTRVERREVEIQIER